MSPARRKGIWAFALSAASAQTESGMQRTAHPAGGNLVTANRAMPRTML